MTYSSLSQFAKLHRLAALPRPHDTWRLLCKPCLGEINGLGHYFRGLAVATNGVIVAIETSAGNVLFGHLQWFEKDDPLAESDLDNARTVFPKHTKTIAEFEELFV